MYGNPYYNNQMNLEKIDNQIKDLENMRRHYQSQQPVFNQTLQLAPSTAGIRHATSIEAVGKELVLADTVFLSEDEKTMWIKDVKGVIRTFSINEVVKKDEKDLLIDTLKDEIERLKKERENEESDTNANKLSSESTEE